MPKLENWSVNDIGLDGSFNEYSYLHGTVSGHYQHRDGSEVFTASITKIEGELVVTSFGDRWELGMVDPEYEKIYPNVKERLFNYLRSKQ